MACVLIARRLATLLQESTNTTKAHLQKVKDLLSQLDERAAAEVGQLQAEVQTERTEREKLETNTTKLKKKIEILKAPRHVEYPASGQH